MTTILAIETSCDETAAAVVENGRRIRSNVVATQIELHRRYGGVFPEVASRQHVLSIQPVIEQALAEAGMAHVSEVDAIAVTYGPGLAGSLLVGVNAAKGMALASGALLLPVNHLEGHIYSNWIVTDGSEPLSDDAFPTVVLIVSGGHTELVLMRGHCRYAAAGRHAGRRRGRGIRQGGAAAGLGLPRRAGDPAHGSRGRQRTRRRRGRRPPGDAAASTCPALCCTTPSGLTISASPA